MASKANWGALALNLFGNAGQGYLEQQKRKQEMEKAAAQAMVEKARVQAETDATDTRNREFALKAEQAKNGQTVIGLDGKIYQSAGISPEFASRLQIPGMMGPLPSSAYSTASTLPGAIQTGPGKLTVQKETKEPVTPTTISMDEFNANPEKYQNTPGLKIVSAPKKSLTPADQSNLFVTKELFKKSLSGPLSDIEAKNLQAASANLDASMVPEEDQGVVYSVKKMLGGDSTFQPKVTEKVPSKGKLTDPALAKQYLTKANGDKVKARTLAEQDGWSY